MSAGEGLDLARKGHRDDAGEGAVSEGVAEERHAIADDDVRLLAPSEHPTKGNVIARYTFSEMAGWKPFGQASWVYQNKSTPALRVDQARIIGTQPAYGLVDLVGGAQLNAMTIQLIVTNVADRRAQLSRFVQTVPSVDPQPYVIPTQPRTIAIQFGQKF